MRKLLILAVLTIAALAVPSAVAASQSQSRDFHATLTGAEEVPAVVTTATGEAEFELNEDETALRFRIEVEDITNAFMGHIHMGARGVNGPIVVWLFPRAASQVGPRFSGELEFSGTINGEDLVGPLKGKSIKDLAALLRSGGAYANVHTNVNPGGEVRGQISSDDYLRLQAHQTQIEFIFPSDAHRNLPLGHSS